MLLSSAPLVLIEWKFDGHDNCSCLLGQVSPLSHRSANTERRLISEDWPTSVRHLEVLTFSHHKSSILTNAWIGIGGPVAPGNWWTIVCYLIQNYMHMNHSSHSQSHQKKVLH